jgi:hypothetical protein
LFFSLFLKNFQKLPPVTLLKNFPRKSTNRFHFGSAKIGIIRTPPNVISAYFETNSFFNKKVEVGRACKDTGRKGFDKTFQLISR